MSARRYDKDGDGLYVEAQVPSGINRWLRFTAGELDSVLAGLNCVVDVGPARSRSKWNGGRRDQASESAQGVGGPHPRPSPALR